MLKLIGFGSAFGVVDPSSFVVKVDAFLRMSGIDYEYVGDSGALGRAPKKKLPIIDDDGKIVADSYFIIEYLKDKYNLTIDDHLSAEQQGLAHLLTKSLDENLYWCLVYSRWMCDDTWPLIKSNFFGNLPIPLKWFVPALVRKGIRKTLYAHGIGRHSNTEIMQIYEHSLRSLSNILGTKRYFFGDKPSSFDAAAYGVLSSLIQVEFDNAFNRQARTYANLVAFCQRVKSEYYNETVTYPRVAA